MKHISVVTGCYNEEENVAELYRQVKEVFDRLNDYTYELIFIDNASEDNTVNILKEIAARDKNIKIIVNTRNFGPICSGYHALLQASGDAVVILASDLQDPPAMITEFIKRWEEGYKIVVGVKRESAESAIMFTVRKCYYTLIKRLAEIPLIKNATGFGLYDKKVIAILREINDPYPYLRGLICEIGFDIYKIEYCQPLRRSGISKNNFYTLYDLAMLGITNHSKVPLRLATFLGFTMAIASFIIAIGYFVAKLLFWNSFSLGIAPIAIAIFFFASVQLLFLGIIGEYIGSIHTQVLHRPLVIEKERINW